MPYHIKKVSNGFKVFTQDEKPLSKESKTLQEAQKQLTALNISYHQEKIKKHIKRK